MLPSDQINDLHSVVRFREMAHSQDRAPSQHGLENRQKYLETPAQRAAMRQRQSKLDPFKAVIAECLERDPHVTAALILQRIKDHGYCGGHAILQEYVRKVRPQPESKRAFVRIKAKWSVAKLLAPAGVQRSA